MGSGSSSLPSSTLKQLETSTHFTRSEITKWESSFNKECGNLTLDKFTELYKSFFPFGDPTLYASLIFTLFDTNNDGVISFDEFITHLSSTSRGSLDEKLQLAFKLYDHDRDGLIGLSDIQTVTKAVYALAGTMVKADSTLEERVDYLSTLFGDDCGIRQFERGVESDESILRALDLYDKLI